MSDQTTTATKPRKNKGVSHFNGPSPQERRAAWVAFAAAATRGDAPRAVAVEFADAMLAAYDERFGRRR